MATKSNTLRMAALTATLAPLAIFIVLALSTRGTGALQLSAGRPLDSKEPVTYFIAEGKTSNGYRPGDRELALWAFQSWQRAAGKGLRFESAAESAALIRLQWAEPGGGEYGETEPLLVHGKRGAIVFIRPDVQALGPEIARFAAADDLLRDSIVYLTCLHELGHALGLEHTRDFRDIMFFFGYGGNVPEYFGRYRRQIHTRGDIAAVSGLSDADVGRIRSLYASE